MNTEVILLFTTAVSIAFLHTAAGPDHYLPFIALSKTRGWTYGRTVWWTVVCGFGHIIGSVLLGVGVAAIGWSIVSVTKVEDVRGSLAAWLLFVFGIGYTAWGLYRLYRNKPHKHFDMPGDGEIYVYEHAHSNGVAPTEKYKVTPWVMFIIFVLGPCEPMIPLLYMPAAKSNGTVMLLMIIVYTVITILTMVGIVTLGYLGVGFFKTEKLHKYIHVIGGVTILICGAGMLFFGW
ncbi:MAG: hypothetical protein QM687_06955 [Ferruginibacter sp.]